MTWQETLMMTLAGGFIAGLVIGAILLLAFITIMGSASEQAGQMLTQLKIECVQESNPMASVIQLGEDTYYCTIENKERQEESEYSVNPAPEG